MPWWLYVNDDDKEFAKFNRSLHLKVHSWGFKLSCSVRRAYKMQMSTYALSVCLEHQSVSESVGEEALGNKQQSARLMHTRIIHTSGPQTGSQHQRKKTRESVIKDKPTAKSSSVKSTHALAPSVFVSCQSVVSSMLFLFGWWGYVPKLSNERNMFVHIAMALH